ncbi:MAG: hypothetical protein R3248_04555 [Candidatus Promineifilaceae bacterium]|nr:hypothetical protein [Candidatus Promineifilaceae bacterium]
MRTRTLVLTLLALVSVPVVILFLIGLFFRGWFLLEPAAAEAPDRQESAPVTHQHVNETLGYSLHYPEGYSVEAQENGDIFVISTLMNHTDPRLEVTVGDAGGATAEAAADNFVGALAGFDVGRSTLIMNGTEAQVVDGVPGQEISRLVFLVHEGRLYQLSFTHADEQLGDAYDRMEQLFHIVVDSFQTIPVDAEATVPPPTSAEVDVADDGDRISDVATYEDQAAGFALDYPAGWYIVDVAPEIKASANNYTISFLSWQPAAGGAQGIPEHGTKVDVSVLPGPVATLQKAATAWKEQTAADPAQTILSEATTTTAGGLEAVRWSVQSSFGRVLVIMTVVDGRPILLSGQGDEALVEWMAHTLRPLGQAEYDDVPVIMNRGAPANHRCVAMIAEPGGQTLDVRSDPGEHHGVIAHLKNWAEIRQSAGGWHEIEIPQGGTGWVDRQQVTLSVGCDAQNE